MYNSYYNSLWGQYIIQIAQIGWQMSQIQLLLQLCPMKRAVKNCNRMERFLYQNLKKPWRKQNVCSHRYILIYISGYEDMVWTSMLLLKNKQGFQ